MHDFSTGDDLLGFLSETEPVDGLFPQLILLYFAAGRRRIAVYHCKMAGHLIPGDATLAVLLDLGSIRCGTVLDLNKAGRLLAIKCAGHADELRVLDCRVG